MYRIQGISNAFKKAVALTTGSRQIGQLLHISNAGEATLTLDDVYFPLTEKFDVDAGDLSASAQVSGIAKVYVELATSIVAGSPVNAGATGLGIKLAATGQVVMGHALETPAGNGSYIPVLLGKSNLP